MTPDAVEGVDAECRVIHELCREYLEATDDPARYCFGAGIAKDRGTNWVDFSESICEQLAADIEVRVRRMVERAGVTV